MPQSCKYSAEHIHPPFKFYTSECSKLKLKDLHKTGINLALGEETNQYLMHKNNKHYGCICITIYPLK